MMHLSTKRKCTGENKQSSVTGGCKVMLIENFDLHEACSCVSALEEPLTLVLLSDDRHLFKTGGKLL